MRPLARLALVALTAVLIAFTTVVPSGALAAETRRPPWVVTLTVQTVPALPGVRVQLDDATATTDAQGRAAFTQPHNFAGHTLRLVDPELGSESSRVRFVRWSGQRDPNQAFRPTVTGLPMRTDHTVTAAFATQYPVTIDVVDDQGEAIAPERLGAVTLRDSGGRERRVKAHAPTWLDGRRPVFRSGRFSDLPVTHSVESIAVDGTEAVAAGTQRIDPAASSRARLTVPLYRLDMVTRSGLFDRHEGRGVVVTHPDGSRTRVGFGPGHEVELTGLPRGTYRVAVDGAQGITAPETVQLSKDKSLTLTVIGRLDLLVIAGSALVVAGGVLAMGRALLRRRRRRAPAPEPDAEPERVVLP